VHTVFELLGHTENDLTYSLGWALANSPALLEAVSASIGVDTGPAESISLQEAAESGGFTDIEIRFDHAHLIFEAKRGWILPTVDQLTKYRQRLRGAPGEELVVISEANRDFAARRLPPKVDGVPVLYVSWAEIITTIRAAAQTARSHSERRMLVELRRYLRGAVRMQDPFSTWTYCVAVANTTPPGWKDSFRDYVDRGVYFHPFGISGWPKVAPAFLAFRWANAVQRIHHVDDYRVVEDLCQEFPEIPQSDDAMRPHVVYSLGPLIGPPSPLPSGTTYRAARLWVALDLLLTASTLKQALDSTKQRRVNATHSEPG
jgi:hypothetical protein